MTESTTATARGIRSGAVGGTVSGNVLLTGATGYVGGRLLPALEARGLRVRCLARRPEFLTGHTSPGTEVVAGDVLDGDSLKRALAGIDTAYYLVHAMGSGSGFEQREHEGARRFAQSARASGVRRIVYLGALGRDDRPLSAHLRSRQEVGRILRDSGVPTLELRASIVIGSGSLSFEMIRALVERLPAMITPRWVHVAAQPIAISDLIAILIEALELPLPASRMLEIGGADRVSYGELMTEYARQRGLRRVMIPVPFLTPRLSSLWLGLVTPLYARVGRELIDSIVHATEVRDNSARTCFACDRWEFARRSRRPYATRTASSPPRAGSTRCPRPAGTGRGRRPALATASSMSAFAKCRYRPSAPSSRSPASEAATAGTRTMRCGACGA